MARRSIGRLIFEVVCLAGAAICVITALSMWWMDEPYPGQSKGHESSSFSIVAWNVESGGSDPAIIANELRELHADIVALSEVPPSEIDRYSRGWPFIHTETGGSDRVQIIYDPDRFDLVRRIELTELNQGNHRAPLVAHFKAKHGGYEFLLVAVHLARGKEEVRLMQAQGLVEWARDQSLPIIAIGDFNFDYDFHTQNGNEAFKAFMRDGIWNWVKPEKLIDTNWADFNHDGKDDFPDSMLDFAFVAGPAKEWGTRCEVVVRDGDFPDGEKRSDHRPIWVSVMPYSATK